MTLALHPITPMRDPNVAALQKAQGHFLNDFHWQLYLVLSFRYEVSPEVATEKAETFVEEMGCYGYIASGSGLVNGRGHVHLLLGGLWEGKARQHKQPAIDRVKALWTHGVVVTADAFDPRRGATRYLPTHHDMTPAGSLRKHRVR